MSDEQRARDSEVFNQELSVDDLDAASGGFIDIILYGRIDDNESYCTNYMRRPIYEDGRFPNCAATVEKGSNCRRNDGCEMYTVSYTGKMTDCHRAWE